MSASSSSSSQSRVPPGFRFHPTEEELLQYYLRKKVAFEKIDLDVIREIDLNKLEPWEIQEKCKIGSTPQNDWYFFSHKDKKYPTGTRTNRATSAGFWKATGRDKVIYASCERIGMRKTLVFYKGRAPHGQKSDWIMHEYRLDDQVDSNAQPSASSSMGESAQEDGWVVCRIFKKKNHPRALEIPSGNSSVQLDAQAQMGVSGSDGAAFEEILQCMGKTCKQEADQSNNMNIYNMDSLVSDPNNTSRYSCSTETEMGDVSLDTFMQMPHLESPTLESHHGTDHNQPLCDNFSLPNSYGSTADGNALLPSTFCVEAPPINTTGESISSHAKTALTNWAVVDRFAASQLNGHSEAPAQLPCFADPSTFTFCSIPDQDLSLPWHLRSLSRSLNTTQDLYCNETGLWPFARLT